MIPKHLLRETGFDVTGQLPDVIKIVDTLDVTQMDFDSLRLEQTFSPDDFCWDIIMEVDTTDELTGELTPHSVSFKVALYSIDKENQKFRIVTSVSKVMGAGYELFNRYYLYLEEAFYRNRMA